MFKTTKGIVLRVTKYKDTKFIANIYTRDFGLIGLIVRKTKEQIILSQALTIADITYKHSNNRSLYYIKESSVEYAYADLIFNNKKLNTSIILCEILSQLLTEKNTELYDFVVNSLIWLDKTNTNYTGFINLFLMKFCKIAGISPISLDNRSCLLNIQDGVFMSNDNTNMSSKFMVPISESTVIKKLRELEFDDLKNYKISSLMHDSVFKYIIKYISTHLSSLRSLKSIEVIKELI